VEDHDREVVAVLRALLGLHQLWFTTAFRAERLDDCIASVERVLAPSWRALELAADDPNG
jgi:hypothetical protein